MTDSGLPSISESDVAESVANDIQKLKPSVMMETLKKLYPFFLALAYDIVIVIITWHYMPWLHSDLRKESV